MILLYHKKNKEVKMNKTMKQLERWRGWKISRIISSWSEKEKFDLVEKPTEKFPRQLNTYHLIDIGHYDITMWYDTFSHFVSLNKCNIYSIQKCHRIYSMQLHYHVKYITLLLIYKEITVQFIVLFSRIMFMSSGLNKIFYNKISTNIYIKISNRKSKSRIITTLH